MTPQTLTPQKQERKPGKQQAMQPQPLIDDPDYRAAGKLKDKVALITGGDSGIGSAIAVAFAKEGAKVAIVYLNEHEDARQTEALIQKHGGACHLIPGDLTRPEFCREAIEAVVSAFGKLDILVNNAGEHWTSGPLEQLNLQNLQKTFQTNVFSVFYLTQAALPHLREGAAIVNTCSVTAYKGSEALLDYASSKGALETFTYSLALQLGQRGIRVNGVAPGPVWTPLIVSSFSEEDIQTFGKNVLMGRAGQPAEIAPSYVFLASRDAAYMTGQVLHPNGGTITRS